MSSGMGMSGGMGMSRAGMGGGMGMASSGGMGASMGGGTHTIGGTGGAMGGGMRTVGGMGGPMGGGMHAGGDCGSCCDAGATAIGGHGFISQPGLPTGSVMATAVEDGCEAGCGRAGCGCGGAGCGGAGCGCGESTGAGVMTFVGFGGDYITETTYKYVGTGMGNLAIVAPKRSNYACLVIIPILLLLLLPLLMMRPGATTTTTFKKPVPLPLPLPVPMPQPVPVPVPVPQPPPPQKKDCTFWGDPHLITFDGARPSFYGDGEYWIVKSDQVKIQGRYMGTAYTFGLAATNKVVVSGPFIQGHKIEVPNLEDGPILIDGKPALTSFGTVQVGGAQITYDGNGELIDEATSVWAKKIVHMYLPGDIQMHVYRWSNYMDLKITMAPLAGGQDGSCGNFNGDPGDDTTDAIFARIGARVAKQDLLFRRNAKPVWTTEMADMFKATCPQDQKDAGQLNCQKELQNPDSVQLQSCMFDYCFGMNEHALRTARLYAPEDHPGQNTVG